MRRTGSAALAIVAALFCCLLVTSAAYADTVVIDSLDPVGSSPRFEPAQVTIKTGDTVRWEFDQATTFHTVTSTSGNWTMNHNAPAGSAPVEHTFPTPGTYTFVCQAHPGSMTGSVTVEDAPPADPLEKVLVFSKTAGFRHTSIEPGITAIQELGAANDFEVTATEDAAAFTDANLPQYDAVVFLSTTGDVLNEAQQAAFERYVQSGGGYVGIHAAADTEYDWKWYGDMLGAYFLSHPAGTPVASVDVTDADEPSTEGLPTRWTREDEWYNFKHPQFEGTGNVDRSPRLSGVHVLATVDESTYGEDDGSDGTGDPEVNDDHPIAWCADFDGGRMWYTGMGHTDASFSDPPFRAHILGGLETVTGAEQADCGEPREAEPEAEDFEKVTLEDDTENPMELDVAPDGRVFYIERDGRVMIIKPDTGQTVEAGRVPVTTVLENGLLGLQLAPDFATSHWVYLAYSEPNGARNDTQVVARYKVVGDALDPLSRQEVFTWQAQRQTCCHSSGSLYFDPAGNLYISTGDNTNPFRSDGMDPIDERPGSWPANDSEYPNVPFAFFDAQRTSANTNNLNGKILRVTPNPDTPGYTVPSGNLFPEAQDTENKTRPEIFAMGFRNPFRFTVDPETGWVLMGDYGPDAGGTVAGRGPQGSVEFNTVTGPGNYGWPYCIRDNTPYNDFNFATRESGPAFSCANPVNTSPNNTGLTNLPPAVGADAWMGYSELDPRHVPDLGGGGAPTGGPRYHYDPDGPPTKFPEFYDDLWFNGEWNNGWIKTFELDDSGAVTDVEPFPFLGPDGCTPGGNNPATYCYKRPMDMDFGPDGSLYLIEWGSGFGGSNADSGIYRIDYVVAGRRPRAIATATPDNGPTPLDVQFSSEGSQDPDGTAITYEWDFDGNGTIDSTDPNPTHRYSSPGVYRALLRVTDQSGQMGVNSVRVVAGNTAPVVTLEIPEEGMFAGFGEKVPYKISVTDAEDGSTAAGTIPCSDVRLNVSLGHDEHAHTLTTLTGCEGTFTASSDGGHGGNVNIFPVAEAIYTDKGGAIGANGALTARDIAPLQPKRKQAEFFTSTGRAPGVTGGGDAGVQVESTTDEGGGQNIGFIGNGDFVSYSPMNFKDVTGLRFRVASGGAGGTIQVRLDAPDGPLVAETEMITPSGGWQIWKDVDLALPNPPAGTHQVFFVFRHPTALDGLMNLNWIEARGKGAANTAAPEATAAASPTSGQAPLEVTFDGEATDPEGQALTYHWDFGVAGTNDDTSNQIDPTYTYQRPGTYTARFTATDADGGTASATVQVRVTAPPSDCPTGAVRSDEFEGDQLDGDRWTVIRPDGTRPPTVQGGALRFPIDNGSIYETGTTARNIIVQPLPDGDVEVTTKITTEPLTENYQQAGLRVYNDDNNWASIHMIHAGGARDFEFIYENNGVARNGPGDKLGGIPADAPLTYWVRLISDGATLRAQYSYDGETFQTVGQPADISGWSNAQIGPVALSAEAQSYPVASFDWIRFNPDESPGGGNGATVTDEFNGSALASPPWSVVRQDQTLQVAGGALAIPAQPGDLYQDKNDAKNLVLQDAPDGPWTATAKVNFTGTTQWHQAGILIYGDDQNFTKFGRIAHTTTGDEKFEFIYENNGIARNEGADSTATLPADFPDDFWVRLTSDGSSVVGHYSIDGNEWRAVGRPAPLPANAKVGLFAFSNAATTTPTARFDSFALTTGSGGGPVGPSFDDQFDGSSLDKTRWNAIVRDNPAAYNVAGGALTITTEGGDIYSGDTSPPPNNFILQSADHAADDWVIETKVDSNVDGGYGQGGLLAYVDGNNYVKLDPIADAGQTRINRIELRTEVNGTPTAPTGTPDPEIAAGTGTIFYLRLTKQGNNYTGEYSRDGETWLPAGTVANPMADPQFGIYAFGPQAAGVGDTVAFDYFLLNGQDPSQCACEGSGDEFEAASLDKNKWNAIVREDDTKYTVQNGNLNVTTVAGDIYTGSDTAETTANFFLQTPDHAGEDWAIETKVNAIELSDGYEQAGLLAYQDDDTYVKFDVISDENQTGTPILNRIELRSEVAGAIQDPQPQVTPLPANDGNVWLRLTKTGTDYKGEYSFDGTTWTQVMANGVPASVANTAMASPMFGLFTLGVNSAGGTARFDSFKVDGEAGCEPPDDNRAPVIESAGAAPETGFAPHEVDFTVAASDPDDDPLTYSWDFDNDGTADSTQQNPSHTYTTPGEKQAKVTVSDGDKTASRTLTVNVLEADDPEARFRVLVFSKTTGFRHDSIDEGHAAIENLGEQESFQVDHTEDAAAFRDDVLEHYDTVVWLSTTGDPLNDTQQAAFERYIKGGGGFTGIHAAADTEYEWKWYGNLVGGYFLSHPPGTPDASVDVEDTDDPSTTGIPERWDRTDEWYNYKPVNFEETGNVDYSPRANVHVLASVDETTYDEQDGNATDDDHPISWCHRYDGGRSWYTGMGHTAQSFSEAHYLTHILGGIEVSAGAAESEECGDETGGPGTPQVEAFADPDSGAAPLQVKFSSAVLDPDGPLNALTYEWDFGDGEMSFARSPRYTYRAAGVYEARLKVTDRDGNVGTDTVTVTVTGNGAPTVEASADPATGGVPLRVEFTAVGDDPNGPENRLTYEWDFGDGGQSFERRPRHVYRTPGVFEAKVTVMDADGATGTDTVTITVTNAAPTVQAAASPRTGTAPLKVSFTSQGSDANGGPLTYAWTFGDGGTASTRNASHTYTQAGTYTATVKVTDGYGASGTATVQVTVANPPGNGAPTVRAAADPKSGTAPLRVRFSAAGSDPDRDPLTYVWEFGDGGKAGGATATHTYAQAGTYTAKVTVKDPGGRTGTATVTVTVNPRGGQGSVRGQSDSAPALRLTRTQKVRTVLAKGLRYRIKCAEVCRVTSKLRLGNRTIGTAKARRVKAGRTGTFAVRLSKAVRAGLLDAMRAAKVKRVKVTLVSKVRSSGSTKTIRKTVTLKR
jgi:cytochrome c